MKHLVVVIDRSGSMQMIKRDMNGALKEWLDTMTEMDPDALLTSALFDDQFELTNTRTPLSEVRFESLRIVPRGGTALNDAIFKTLANIKAREDALVLIVTDGGENSSVDATLAQVKDRIEELTEQGVQFEYLSASPDAFAHSQAYGFAPQATTQFASNSGGVQTMSSVMDRSSSAYMTRKNTQTVWDTEGDSDADKN